MKLLDTRRTRIDTWLNSKIAADGYREVRVVTGFLYERGWAALRSEHHDLDVKIISSVHVDGGTKTSLEQTQTLKGQEHVRYDVRFFDRVTQHAKLFLLTRSDHGKADVAVIGSSNLTGPGLGIGNEKNLELNYVVTDAAEISELNQWFSSLWDESRLANQVDLIVDESQRATPKKTYFAQLLPGILTYADIIQMLLSDQKANFMDYSLAAGERYQRDAIDEMDFRLQCHGCCFLSDDVGLGKTVMGAGIVKRAVARMLRQGGDLSLSALVVCPKPVEGQWASHIVSMISELASESAVDTSRLMQSVQVVTYGQERAGLWQDIDRDLGASAVSLVLVDEAHRLRNTTNFYRWLSDLDAELRQRGARPRYLFLTATPINNSFTDLYNLFRLSLPNSFWVESGIEHIRDFLRDIDRNFSVEANDSQQQKIGRLSHALNKIMIRRDVSYLNEHYGSDDLARLRIPRVNGDAQLIRAGNVNLGVCAKQIGDFLEKSLFVPYRLSVAYEQMHETRRNEIQTSVSGVLRSHLSKSIQSSFSAGIVSLDNIIRRCRDIMQTGERTAITNLEDDFGQDSTDGQIAADEEIAGHTIDTSALAGVKDQAEKDIKHLESFAAFLRQHEAVCDVEKAQSLLIHLDREHPTLVFTEYRATARWLIAFLKEKGIKVFDAPPEALDSNCALQQELLRLDPSQDSSLRAEAPNFAVYVLTDKYSEGRNFHKCRRIINYDLPWNPIRKTQRQGRIVRVGSPHQEVSLYSLSYTHDALAAYANPEELLREKLKKIAAVFGRGHNGDVLTEGNHFINYFVRYNRSALGDEAQSRVDALGLMQDENSSAYFYQIVERIMESGYEQEAASILHQWAQIKSSKNKTLMINDTRRKIFAVWKSGDRRDALLWCERMGQETKVLRFEEIYNLAVDQWGIVDRLDNTTHQEVVARGADREIARLKRELAQMVAEARVGNAAKNGFVDFLNRMLHLKPQQFFATMKTRLAPHRNNREKMQEEITAILSENSAVTGENQGDASWVVLCTEAYADEESTSDPKATSV